MTKPLISEPPLEIKTTETTDPYGFRLETIKALGVPIGETLLYIGAKPRSLRGNLADLSSLFRPTKITLVESWPPNCEGLRKACRHEVVETDILDFNPEGRQWGVVVWWHGPEHIPPERFSEALEKVQTFSSGITILGMPWGRSWPQGAAEGNPFETHRMVITPPDLHLHGFHTHSILLPGLKEGPGCHITAWKRK